MPRSPSSCDWAEARGQGQGAARRARSSRSPAAGRRCARRSTGPRSSSTWWRCWRRCWRRWRWRSPSRDFASRHLDDCAMLRVLGLPQRTIALQYAIEFALIGLLASVRRRGARLRRALRLRRCCSPGLVDAALPPPSALAGAVRRRRRLHPAVRLRPAAGAAAGAGAAAARDPARRRRAQAGLDRGAGRRRGRLRGPAARGGERPQARA